jgi:hypothetical protein
MDADRTKAARVDVEVEPTSDAVVPGLLVLRSGEV